MPRKGENIRKRKDGRWEARYVRGRDCAGKIQYGYIYGRTYTAVKQKRNEKLGELRQAADVPELSQRTNDSRFSSIALLWKGHIRHAVKGSTYSNYDTILEKHIIPALGTASINELSNAMIHEFVRQKVDSGMSPGSIRVILGVLKGVMKYAQELQLYAKEPIKFPVLQQGQNKVKVMEEKNYKKLEKYLLNGCGNFDYGILLCMCTGIRVGELSGLRWGDINFETGAVFIQRTVVRIKNIDREENPEKNKIQKTLLHVGIPKTSTSIREIPLPDFILEKGRKLRGKDDTFILTGSEKCMEPRRIQRKYQSLLDICSIPPIKIHALRHQFSCRWIEQGFDTKSLSEILGHASVQTTLNIYVHINSDVKRKYMNRMLQSI